MSKFFLKKSWVTVDVCVEDYYNSGTTLEDLQKNLNWSAYSNIVSREAKFSRHTIEEIDEKTYKDKIEKSNGTPIKQKKFHLKIVPNKKKKIIDKLFDKMKHDIE